MVPALVVALMKPAAERPSSAVAALASTRTSWMASMGVLSSVIVAPMPVRLLTTPSMNTPAARVRPPAMVTSPPPARLLLRMRCAPGVRSIRSKTSRVCKGNSSTRLFSTTAPSEPRDVSTKGVAASTVTVSVTAPTSSTAS